MSDDRVDGGAWDDEDLAIARALGAPSPDLPGVAVGPAGEAEAEYEAVLAQLPFDAVAPPAGLEDRVVRAALARRPAAVRSLEPGRGGRAGRRARAVRGAGAVATLVAAAVIVVVLFAGRPATGPGSPGARVEPAAANGSVARVLGEPGTRLTRLRTSNGDAFGRLAIGPDRQGYLFGFASATGARWLWLDTSSGPVRVGRLPATGTVHFVVLGALDEIHGAYVTAERAGTPAVPGPVTARGAFAD